MGKKEIDAYVIERLKTPSGEWASDVMFCILCCLENCVPYPNSKDYSDTVEEYEGLVEVALEYLSFLPNFENISDLLMVVVQDFSETKQDKRVGVCLDKVKEIYYSFYFFERKNS